jgi:hypothetical protein
MPAVGNAEADARRDGCTDMVQSVRGSDISQVSVSEGNVKSRLVRCEGERVVPTWSVVQNDMWVRAIGESSFKTRMS